MPEATSQSPASRVLRLQREIGNRATRVVLARNGPKGDPSGGRAGTTSRRVVEVDGQVFSEINRGNVKMADAMKAMKVSGARIAIGEAVGTEMFGEAQGVVKRAAYQAMLDDFGIEVAPADLRTSPQARFPYLEPLSQFASGKDATAAAEAAAAGVEYWSTEKTFQNPKNRTAIGKISGFRLASPESEIQNEGKPWDYAVGRQLLGLEPITIDADGTVRRDPPTGGGGTSGGGGSSGGGPPADPRYTTGQRATAAVALIALGVNLALNSWLAHRNKKAIEEALAKLDLDLRTQQAQFPTLGFLLTFRFSAGTDSGEGPTATGRFEGVGYIPAPTRRQAEQNFSNPDPSKTYEFAWIDPIDFSALAPPSWGRIAEAQLVDSDDIEFQQVGFRQHGIVGQSGFFGRGRFSAGSSKDDWIRQNFRFFVLSMPPTIPYYNVGRQLDQMNVSVQDVYALGGVVPTLDIGQEGAVPIVPANPATKRFLDKVSSYVQVDDKANALAPLSYIEHVAWLPPSQIHITRFLDAGYANRTAQRDEENQKAIEQMHKQAEERARLRKLQELEQRRLEEEDERRRQEEQPGAGAGSRSG